MTESRKFRFPFIELLSIAIVVAASVIALYPGADKYVVSLVKGKTSADLDSLESIENDLDQPTTATHLASSQLGAYQFFTAGKLETETQTLEQRTRNNSFEAPESTGVPIDTAPMLAADEQLGFADDNQITRVPEDHMVSALTAPVHSLDTTFDEPDFDNTIPDLPDLPEEQFIEDGSTIELTAPLAVDDVAPETEFTTELEPAPSSIPNSQISLELPSNYDMDEDIIPVEPEDTRPEVRQLPIWEPDTMRVIEGSLTPAVSPLRKLPQHTTTFVNPTIDDTDDEAVTWRSTVVKNKLFYENDLEPAIKQIAAPKIQTASLPEFPASRPRVPQPFAGGFIPEHIPGQKARMMSREMLEGNNDFELPEPTAIPAQPIQRSPKTNPLR